MDIAGIRKFGMDQSDSSVLGALEDASAEVVDLLSKLDGATIKDYYLNRGTDRMKSVSTPVNKLILEGLQQRGWILNWRFIEVNSQQATFEAAKEFGQWDGVRIAIDIGSRHAMSAFGYFVRGTAASSSVDDGRLECGGNIVLAFTAKTIAWGLWNKANSSFESLQEEATIALPLMRKPLWLIGIDPTQDLKIQSRASGLLTLEVL
jgi:hypothetical protein